MSVCSLLPWAEMPWTPKTESTGILCWLISPGRKNNTSNPKHSQTSFAFGQTSLKKSQTALHPMAALLWPFWQGLPHPNSFPPNEVTYFSKLIFCSKFCSPWQKLCYDQIDRKVFCRVQASFPKTISKIGCRQEWFWQKGE